MGSNRSILGPVFQENGAKIEERAAGAPASRVGGHIHRKLDQSQSNTSELRPQGLQQTETPSLGCSPIRRPLS